MTKSRFILMDNRALTLVAGAGWLASALASLGAEAAAAPAAAPAAPPAKWESIASAGLTLTSGNSENFLATLGFNTTRKWKADEVLAGLSAGYGETKDKTVDPATRNTTDQYVKGFGQWNHLFSARWYGGLRVDGNYDNVAGVDYRFILSPLVGYYFIKNPKTFLAAEAGPSFILEKLRGKEADQYMGLRVAERFEHKLSDRAKIWQTAEWVPQIDDFDNWILNIEAGVSASITKSVELQLKLQDTYDNQPAHKKNSTAFLEKNDLKLIAGIGYKF